MHPSNGSASQAQGYVSKGWRFLSDAPFGRFSESLARRLPLQAAHVFGAYSRSTLSELRQAWAEFLLTETLGAGMWPSGFDLGPPKLESCLRWPLALKSEHLLLPGALCALLYGGGLSAHLSLCPFRPSSHKYGLFSRAQPHSHKEILRDKSQ